MTSHDPIVQIVGKFLQLPVGDTIKNPENATFSYTDGKLTEVAFDNGTITLTYNGGQLDTVTSTYTGRTLTFAYSGGSLSTITVT